MNIEWRQVYINNVEMDYMISNDGQVKSKTSNEIRVPTLSNGYLHIILYKKGIMHTIGIHRLVALHFVLNDDIINKTQVDHKDGNKLNNVYTNLEWVTPKENTTRAIQLGLANPKHGNQPVGTNSGVAKHTETDARKVCQLLSSYPGRTYQQIADEAGVDKDFVRSIMRGSWRHISKEYNIAISNIPWDYKHRITEIMSDAINSGIENKFNVYRSKGIKPESPLVEKYVRVNRDYIQDKSSSTIPWIIYDFKLL